MLRPAGADVHRLSSRAERARRAPKGSAANRGGAAKRPSGGRWENPARASRSVVEPAAAAATRRCRRGRRICVAVAARPRRPRRARAWRGVALVLLLGRAAVAAWSAQLAAGYARRSALLDAHAPARAAARLGADTRDRLPDEGDHATGDSSATGVGGAHGSAGTPGLRGRRLRGRDLGLAPACALRSGAAALGRARAGAPELLGGRIALLVAPALPDPRARG